VLFFCPPVYIGISKPIINRYRYGIGIPRPIINQYSRSVSVSESVLQNLSRVLVSVSIPYRLLIAIRSRYRCIDRIYTTIMPSRFASATAQRRGASRRARRVGRFWRGTFHSPDPNTTSEQFFTQSIDPEGSTHHFLAKTFAQVYVF
jgi:hypothetical protein